MLEYLRGDILSSDCQAITNAVNCRGIMGAGLAKAFRSRFPTMYDDYRETCRCGKLEIGKIHSWENPEGEPHWIVNFPTMSFPGEKTQRNSIVLGFIALDAFIRANAVESIALPALGCGIGRFPWREFKRLAEEFASNLPDVWVAVYEPH